MGSERYAEQVCAQMLFFEIREIRREKKEKGAIHHIQYVANWVQAQKKKGELILPERDQVDRMLNLTMPCRR